MISIIAAVSDNGVIGLKDKNGNYKLPFNYPDDLNHFKKTTENSVVIMGRNTFESIGKPLKNRENIIVTKKFYNNIKTANSIQEALHIADNFKKPIWLIGGASIYDEGMNYADQIVLTITKDKINDSSAIKFPWINPNIYNIYLKEDNINNNFNLKIFRYKRI